MDHMANSPQDRKQRPLDQLAMSSLQQQKIRNDYNEQLGTRKNSEASENNNSVKTNELTSQERNQEARFGFTNVADPSVSHNTVSPISSSSINKY